MFQQNYGDIGIDGKRLVKEVLAECDRRAVENGQEFIK